MKNSNNLQITAHTTQ